MAVFCEQYIAKVNTPLTYNVVCLNNIMFLVPEIQNAHRAAETQKKKLN